MISQSKKSQKIKVHILSVNRRLTEEIPVGYQGSTLGEVFKINSTILQRQLKILMAQLNKDH